MKRLSSILILLMMIWSGVFAQDNYRLLVRQGNSTKGFVVDRVDDITFVAVDGEVKADITVDEVGLDFLTVTVQRTPACAGFRIAVCSRSLAAYYSDYPTAMIEYVEQNGSQILTEDFNRGHLSGIELEAGSDYSVVTVGYDGYGIASDICRADFTTPRAGLVGNPKVTTTIKSVGKYDFTIYCEPNDDVRGYSCVAGEAGSIQSQYDMYAAWFGFTNLGDMIRSWGYTYSSAEEVSWDDMQPGTDYEIFIQPWDMNENYADCDIVGLRTESLGGSGEANVNITIGDYKLQDWNGEQLPSQFITFAPNDQASCYRYAVYMADGENGYDANKTELQNDLQQDPPQAGMLYWFFYETLTTDFQIDPNTECVVIAAAKNADGVWGPVNEVRFTTPATASAKASSMSIRSRQIHQKPILRMNRIPVLKQNKITIK